MPTIIDHIVTTLPTPAPIEPGDLAARQAERLARRFRISRPHAAALVELALTPADTWRCRA